jgi:hypothetical protein
MTFVRKKKVKGWEYYQLVESRRVEGKPRQKVLVHLGHHPSVDVALEEWPKEIRRLRRHAARERRRTEYLLEGSHAHRDAIRRADTAERRAKELKGNLEKLRELRKEGVV